MACSTCAQRRAMLAAAARRAKSGNLGEAARRIAEAAVHLVRHPPRQPIVLRLRGTGPGGAKRSRLGGPASTRSSS